MASRENMQSVTPIRLALQQRCRIKDGGSTGRRHNLKKKICEPASWQRSVNYQSGSSLEFRTATDALSSIMMGQAT